MQLTQPGMAWGSKDLIQLRHFARRTISIQLLFGSICNPKIIFDNDQFLNIQSISKVPHILTFEFLFIAQNKAKIGILI